MVGWQSMDLVIGWMSRSILGKLIAVVALMLPECFSNVSFHST
jgi:hypothetical protein